MKPAPPVIKSFIFVPNILNSGLRKTALQATFLQANRKTRLPVCSIFDHLRYRKWPEFPARHKHPGFSKAPNIRVRSADSNHKRNGWIDPEEYPIGPFAAQPFSRPVVQFRHDLFSLCMGNPFSCGSALAPFLGSVRKWV